MSRQPGRTRSTAVGSGPPNDRPERLGEGPDRFVVSGEEDLRRKTLIG